MKKVHAVTGNSECLNNVYLSACLERFFESGTYRFIESKDDADVLVLNVCNVFVETPALVESYREYARSHPAKQVLVLGCVPGGAGAEPGPENFHVLPYGRLVRDPGLIGKGMGFAREFSLLKADDVLDGLRPGSRLPYPPSESCFITIGSGCQGRCTYCSIRLARGGARSVGADEIVADAKAGLAKGRFRLALISDDAGCWGCDLGLDLPGLLGRLTEACPSARFALLDFNPVNLPRLYERLRPFLGAIDYLYLPLQAGSDRVLGLMERGYRRAEILGLVEEMRREHPGLYLETDIIVGFPSETREEFRESLAAAREFHHAAFVPFVPKPDTPAEKMPGRLGPQELALRMELVRRLGSRFGFKAVDPRISASGHGDVGKLASEPAAAASAAPATASRYEVIEKPGKSPVLSSPALACLARYRTLNLTEGCAFDCLYCSQATAPGAGERIVLYSDAPALLRKELDGLDKMPELVYFSAGAEPFLPEPRVLAVLRETMGALLDRGVFLLVETRAAIPAAFLDLFARHPTRVKVQVGLSTADDRVRRLLEPNAAPVGERLLAMKALVERGVPVEAGVGPLMPELEDGEQALARLCDALAGSGATRGSVSFVFLDRGARRRLGPLALDGWSFREMAGRRYRSSEKEPCSGETLWIAEPEYRRETFRRLKELARARGLELTLCACNNRLKTAFPTDDSPAFSAG